MFAENLGKFPCVYPVDSGNLLLLEPLVKALHRLPMAVFKGIVGDEKSADMYPVRFEVPGDAEFVLTVGRNTVISHKRISHTENLTGIRGVSKAFRIAYHCRGEYDFPVTRSGISERIAPELHPVLQFESCTEFTVHCTTIKKTTIPQRNGRHIN